MKVFELTNITKMYGVVRALTNIDLTISAGERVALVGSSGAGKSTLLGLLNGTVQPSTGMVTVLGENLAHHSPIALRRVQRQIGTIYQQFHLVDNLAVIHNVNAGHLGHWSLAKSLLSLFWPQEVAGAHRALDQVGIPDKLYARTGDLSGGQQQRVALARVLIQNPKAILADEPIASIDPERSRTIMNLLRDLTQQEDKTLIASLHDIDFALSHFERVIGLRQGSIFFDLPATEVRPKQIEALYRIDGRTKEESGYREQV